MPAPFVRLLASSFARSELGLASASVQPVDQLGASSSQDSVVVAVPPPPLSLEVLS